MEVKLRNQSENGFTLIEVLVSMLIFSIAILGLIRAGTENIQAVNQVQQKQIAGIIADNQLILAMVNKDNISAGTRQDFIKMAGKEWHWKISTEKTPQANFFKLTVEVRERNAEQIILRRTAFSQKTS